MEYFLIMTKTRQIGFRVPEEEYQKLMNVLARAKERTLGYAPLGDVIREAIGLIPMKIITQADRDYLAGKIATLSTEDIDYRRRVADMPISGRDDVTVVPSRRKAKLSRKKKP